jgi:hypothetical protein
MTHVESDLRKVSDDGVGVERFAGCGRHNRKRETARGFGCLQALRSVLDHEAAARIGAQPAGRLEERLGMRLPVHHVIDRHQYRGWHEPGGRDASCRQRYGARCGDGVLGTDQGRQSLGRAGEDHNVVKVGHFQLGDPQRSGLLQVLRDPSAYHRSRGRAMVQKQVHRGKPVFAFPSGPGPENRWGRIDQRSIQVEDDRLEDLIGKLA